MGHFGFSYVGLIYLIMLFVPNILWTKRMPVGYSSLGENKALVAFERCGEVLVSCCALFFDDFNVHSWSIWTLWLVASFCLMVLYEIWWVRYFRSKRQLEDFYSNLFFIPLAGATLPVFAFFLLGIYGRVIWLVISSLILGVGHIGIHIEHKMELKNGRV